MITKPIAEKAQLKLFINPREISLFPNLLFLINRKKNHATFLIAKVKKVITIRLIYYFPFHRTARRYPMTTTNMNTLCGQSQK